MHWFFALTEDSTAFREYADMIMVAVHTARKFTSLVSHCLYDGGDSDFTQWLTQHDVRIIRTAAFFTMIWRSWGGEKTTRILRLHFPARSRAWSCRASWPRRTALPAFFIPTAMSSFSARSSPS